MTLMHVEKLIKKLESEEPLELIVVKKFKGGQDEVFGYVKQLSHEPHATVIEIIEPEDLQKEYSKNPPIDESEKRVKRRITGLKNLI